MTAATEEMATRLVKAMVYLKHPGWFAPSVDVPAWLVARPLDEVRMDAFLHDRTPKHIVVSTDQIRARCLKGCARMTEWIEADKLEPGLIAPPKTEHGWTRKPEQLKGLCAVNVEGEVIPGATPTPDNAAELFGVAANPHTMAAQAARDGPDLVAHIITNADVRRLSVSELEQQLKGPHLRENVRARSIFSRGRWSPRGIGSKREDTAKILKLLVEEDGLEPGVVVEELVVSASEAEPAAEAEPASEAM